MRTTTTIMALSALLAATLAAHAAEVIKPLQGEPIMNHMKKTLMAIAIFTLAFALSGINPLYAAEMPVKSSPSAQAVVLNGDAKNLERGFKTPPNSAKPFVFWFWIGEQVTKEGITADLEAMARFGIGGYIIFHSSGYNLPDLPSPKMLSPEWFELFKHALKESERLGLEAGINNCPGYCTDGGPWVTPEFGQQEVVWSEVMVAGGKPVTVTLPEPAVKFTMGRKFNYSDIAVVAVPLPENAQDFRSLVKTVTCSLTPEPAKLDYSTYKNPDVKADFPPETPDPKSLVDGRIDSGIKLTPPTKDKPLVLEYELSEPFTARGFELAFLPVPMSAPTQMTLVIEAAAAGEPFRRVGEFKSSSTRSEANIAPRFFVELDPVQATRFRVTVWEANFSFDFKWLLPSAAVFHSVARTKIITPFNSSIPFTDVKYERAKPAAPRWNFDPKRVVDLSRQFKADGTLAWDAPAGKWLVLRLGHSCTGQTNHPPPPGMDGLEIDKLSKEAYDLHWAKGIQPYLDAAGNLTGRVFTTIHRDSPECGDHNWTPKMPEEFQRRRGYSIIPFLPIFAGVAAEAQNGFQTDLSQTLADLTHENNYDYSHEVIRKHGMKSSTEAYSRIFSSSIAARTADIPMSEVWLFSHNDGSKIGKEFAYNTDATKTMAGVSQQHGQRYVGAEAFTQGFFPPGYWAIPYEDHPYSAKWRGDLMMADGVNRFYVHDFTHQPYLDRAPGVTYAGWGWNFDRNQTWWNLGSATGTYWARCHWMLQEGKAAFDVCVWSANETFFGAIHYTTRNWNLYGNNFTELGNDVFMSRGAADQEGYFTTGAGLRYKVLIGVSNQAMSVAELRKLAGLIENGVIYIGGAPQGPKGLANLAEEDEEFKELRNKIWGGVHPQDGKPLGKGRVYDLGFNHIQQGEYGDSYIRDILKKYLLPDFEVPGQKIRIERDCFTFQHRRSADADWYFVANLSPEAKRVDCIFRLSGKHPELWRPDTGTTEKLNNFTILPDARISVPLAFDPSGSAFVVFREPLNSKQQVTAVAGDPIGTRLADGIWHSFSNGAWELTLAEGGKRQVEVKGLPAPVAITGAWEVSFQANRGAPASVTLPELASLSEHKDLGVRYFSGEAVYSKAFEAPANLFAKGRRLHLDLGAVGVIAEVTLNGKTFAPSWKPPYRVDVTDTLKPGANTLKVRVANTWLTRILGDLRLPIAERVIVTPGSAAEKSMTKDSKMPWTTLPITYVSSKMNATTPLPLAGLIGPVTLVPEAEKNAGLMKR